MSFSHTPVLIDEVLEYIKPKPGKTIVDCTAGGGGHSKALLERILPGGKLIALDQDLDAVKAAENNLSSLGVENFKVIHLNFEHLKTALSQEGISQVDGILYDLGVSSFQLDTGERGFSYQVDAPLDMRMDRQQKSTAYDLVNNCSAEELTRILFDYGEERWAKRIAGFIIQEREKAGAIATTGVLVEVIKKAIPSAARREGPHPAKRTFQALRIAVNRELEILQKSFRDGVDLLGKEGRLAVITFHSLEDRIAKTVFQELAKGCTCPKDMPQCVCGKKPVIKIVTGKPVIPSEEELSRNPRARSAKLRVVEKF